MAAFRFEAWPTEHRVVTQYFGANPENYAQFGLPGHEGVDIRAPNGSRVFAVAPGEVIRAHNSPRGHNYGIHVRLAHAEGYETTYAHLESLAVSQGQVVSAGDLLGRADNTGNSFGAHLHLTLRKSGVRHGRWPPGIIDPLPFLLPLLGWQRPTGPFVEGWVMSAAIMQNGDLAQANEGGVTLYVTADYQVPVPTGTMMIVTGQHEPFARVQVPRAAVGLEDETPPQPAPEPPPTLATVDGWAWADFLTVVGSRAVVGPHGVHVRAEPRREARNLGLLAAGSSVTLLGESRNNFHPIRASRGDFLDPVLLPDRPPAGNGTGPQTGVLGWALQRYLRLEGRLATVSRFGVNLRDRPETGGRTIGLVKGFATVSLAGAAQGDYAPILVHPDDALNLVTPLPPVTPPAPLPAEIDTPVTAPLQESTAGWLLVESLRLNGNAASVGPHGGDLRNAPRRDATILGYVPAQTLVVVTGSAQGEYRPVRVADAALASARPGGEPAEPLALGRARIGLHASADPAIPEAEFQEFAALRPGIIKALSFHRGEDIARLAREHPDALWVLRAFLDFGGRNVRPVQFRDDTLSDMRRALGALKGRSVVVELHNEPNVVAEGLGSSWRDGADFASWWLELLNLYRQALPGVRFLYPGLSPGSTVSGVKLDHVQFVEASRQAVEAADGLAVHVYWSNVYPMSRALAVVDDYISRYRSMPIWITEASINRGLFTSGERARQYLAFWKALQDRPVVRGVTFFVASASNPRFAEEVWVGKGMGALLGKR